MYISLRFQWKFAVPVIVALAHDVLITVGIYALLGREVTTATVAAVLTVLGYSIYDTIIIFDRIRENIPLMKRGVVPDARERLALGDDPTLAGDDVHHARADRLAARVRRRHAQGLRVRTAHRDRSGACSSIFIAAPLLAMFKEREPEYARRRDDENAVEVGRRRACSRAPQPPRRPSPRRRATARRRRLRRVEAP